jgi:hypothetical protein
LLKFDVNLPAAGSDCKETAEIAASSRRGDVGDNDVKQWVFPLQCPQT